jgi:gas vesicle protein
MRFHLVFLLVLIPLFMVQSQPQRERLKIHQSKIDELEKAKLIESLQMDEETSVRFFARRNEHRLKLKEINDNLNAKLKNIDEKVNTIKDDNNPEFKKLVDDYISTHQQLADERKRFLNSLTDILSAKQIAKLTLFERKFKEEIRDVLLKKRKWRTD